MPLEDLALASSLSSDSNLVLPPMLTFRTHFPETTLHDTGGPEKGVLTPTTDFKCPSRCQEGPGQEGWPAGRLRCSDLQIIVK